MTSPRTLHGSPKKLLDSKWTAVTPRDKEKHFLVTKVLESGGAGSSVTTIELRAVISKRVRVVPWTDLKDPDVWRRGWL